MYDLVFIEVKILYAKILYLYVFIYYICIGYVLDFYSKMVELVLLFLIHNAHNLSVINIFIVVY